MSYCCLPWLSTTVTVAPTSAAYTAPGETAPADEQRPFPHAPTRRELGEREEAYNPGIHPNRTDSPPPPRPAWAPTVPPAPRHSTTGEPTTMFNLTPRFGSIGDVDARKGAAKTFSSK